MDSLASSSSSNPTLSSPLSRKHRLNREKFVSRVISPAIQGQSCPICLNPINDSRKAAVISVCLHSYCLRCIRKWSDFKRRCPLCNAPFDCWYFNISLSKNRFFTERLNFRTRDRSRILQSELVVNNRRTRPLPRHRTFGRPGSVSSQVIAERKLQWRASVYKRRLRAVPLNSRSHLEQNVSANSCVKERVLQRVEPWIRRELHALLMDPNPSIIVHVASSLYISSLEKNPDVLCGQPYSEDNFLAPLRAFLHDSTNTFWHELRCFAQSSLNMDAYDAVVKYKWSG